MSTAFSIKYLIDNIINYLTKSYNKISSIFNRIILKMTTSSSNSYDRIPLTDSIIKASITSNGLLLKNQSSIFLNSVNASSNGCFPSCFSSATASSSKLDLNYDSNGEVLIPYRNILWIDTAAKQSTVSSSTTSSKDLLPESSMNDNIFQLNYVLRDAENSIAKPFKINIDIENRLNESNDNIISNIMGKSYKDSQPGKSVLVIVNPNSGQGKAIKLYHTEVEPILKIANYKIDILKTLYNKHAEEFVKELDINKYDMIICASGDGIPHEVINGLYLRKDRAQAFNKLVITQCPCGSGNAMSLSCHHTLVPSVAAFELIKNPVVKCDLMALSMKNRPTKLSFLSQTYGVIAEADIGTEWMRFIGQVRFDLGVLSKVLSRAKYPCSIAVKYLTKTKEELNEYYEKHYDGLNSVLSGATDESNKLLTEEDFNLQYYDGNLQDDELPKDIVGDTGYKWDWIDQDICSNLGIFYSGKMPYISKDVNFFPAALPNDGSIDIVVTDARTNLIQTADALLSLDKGLHVWKEEVQHYKVRAFKLVPKLYGRKSFISVDGESFPFETFQVEILENIMKTTMSNGEFKETGFKEKISK